MANQADRRSGLIPSVWHLFTGSVNMRSKEMPEQIKGGTPKAKNQNKVEKVEWPNKLFGVFFKKIN